MLTKSPGDARGSLAPEFPYRDLKSQAETALNTYRELEGSPGLTDLSSVKHRPIENAYSRASHERVQLEETRKGPL